jgi:hypothetical protein
MEESYLDRTHRLAKEEFELPLRKYGFKKKGSALIRNINGQDQVFKLQWISFGTRKDDFNYFWFVGDENARKLLTKGLYFCGSDISQVGLFIGSGNNDYAQEILEPIGLFELYQKELSRQLKIFNFEPYCLAVKKYSKTIPDYRDNISGIRWVHRYRWSSENSFRKVLQHDLKAFLVYFDLVLKTPPQNEKFVTNLKKEFKKHNLIFYEEK